MICQSMKANGEPCTNPAKFTDENGNPACGFHKAEGQKPEGQKVDQLGEGMRWGKTLTGEIVQVPA